MFLRADHFNAQQAAERMAKYFTNKLSLFGEDKLVKKITLDDLNEQDKKVLFSDGNIVLPHKDRAGRPIWYSDCSKADYEHAESTVRLFDVTVVVDVGWVCRSKLMGCFFLLVLRATKIRFEHFGIWQWQR